MPDFDRFERLVIAAMTASPEDLPDIHQEISQIPEVNRPKFYKGLQANELAEWIDTAREYLKSLGYPYNILRSNNNNQRGMDLLAITTNQQIELKTGQVTDANLGLGTLMWAFDDGEERIKDILHASMKERIRLANANNFSRIRQNQTETMVALGEFFKSQLMEGRDAPHKLSILVRCVARGITRLEAMKKLTNIPEEKWNSPIMLHADRTFSWKKVNRPFQLFEAITVSQIRAPTKPAITSYSLSGRERISRAYVVLKGCESGRTAQIYPNYKNSYQSSKSGLRIEAKYWVKTPCFHIWIDKVRI